MEARRKFDAQFKEGAVRIVRETGKPIAGRYRDRYTTGLRPARDPGVSTAPSRTLSRSNPYKQVSTVTGDCLPSSSIMLC